MAVDICGTSIEEWYRQEEESKWNMPARTTDDLGEDDPYRVILFNDIRPFCIPSLPMSFDQLPVSFLSFCGVNLSPPEFSTNEPQMKDAWLYNDFDRAGFWPPSSDVNMIEWINGEAVEPERLPGIDGPFTFKRKLWPMDIDYIIPLQRLLVRNVSKNPISIMSTNRSSQRH